MPIAVFQKKVFQVSGNNKYLFDDLTWGSALNTESQEKLKSKPSTYIKGIALSTLNFSVPLRMDLGQDVRKEIESWEAILEKQAPDYFVLGTKPVGKNKWLLKSVGVSDTQVDNKGFLRKAVLKLDFEEYVREGKAEAKNNSSSSSNAPAISSGSSRTTIQPNQYIYDPPTKSEQKRKNVSAKQPLQ